MEWFDRLYSNYEVVYINVETLVVRFENDDWFEEATLTEALAFWIITKGVEVIYE